MLWLTLSWISITTTWLNKQKKYGESYWLIKQRRKLLSIVVEYGCHNYLLYFNRHTKTMMATIIKKIMTRLRLYNSILNIYVLNIIIYYCINNFELFYPISRERQYKSSCMLSRWWVIARWWWWITIVFVFCVWCIVLLLLIWLLYSVLIILLLLHPLLLYLMFLITLLLLSFYFFV